MSVPSQPATAAPEPSRLPGGDTPTARTRNPRGQGGRLRGELIEAADRLLARSGDVGSLTLRGVAREAGVATPSIYRHFADKRAIVRAVLDRRFAELGAAIRDAAMGASGARAQLRAGCLAYCRFAAEHPGAYRVLFGLMASPEAPADRSGPTQECSGIEVSAGPAEAGRDGVESPSAPTAVSPTDATATARDRRTGAAPPTPAEPALDARLAGLPGADAFAFLVSGAARSPRQPGQTARDPFLIATAIWSALHGTVTLRASLPGFPWPPLASQVDATLDGLLGSDPG